MHLKVVMFRVLTRIFRRSLTLNSINSTNSTERILECSNMRQLELSRQLFELAAKNSKHLITTNAKGECKTEIEASRSDSDYIVPYEVDHKKALKDEDILYALRERFRLTYFGVKSNLGDENLREILRVHQNKQMLLDTLDTLALEGISKRTILENPWIIAMEKTRLTSKLNVIRTLQLPDINHFVPFIRLSITRVKKLVAAMKAESKHVPFGNRVYYICHMLEVEPRVVTKYLPKRLFVLEMPFEMLQENLKNMIRYDVSSLDVLKDLWAFRYTPKSVQQRLERAKRAKKNKIMPWMVRCPESVLQRSLQLTVDEFAVLDGKKSVAEYIAERLQFNIPEANAIMARHPQVYRVRVTKIKEILDFLLNAGFTRFEIAQVPRILCHSLDTTKKRLAELENLNCRPSSLVILCRSKREYERFVKNWSAGQEKHYLSKNSGLSPS